MPNYYKGNLILNSVANNNSSLLCSYVYSRNADNERCEYYDEFKEKYAALEVDEKKILKSFFYHLEDYQNGCEVTNQKVIGILNKIVGDFIFYNYDKYENIPIIFESFKDINGVKYGKELYTGLIFPISQRDHSGFIKEKYRIREYKTNFNYEYRINKERIYDLPQLDLCEVTILDSSLANQNEILEYQNRFSKGFGRKKRQREFENKIRSWYNKNVYNSEIVPAKENETREKRIDQSSETKIMSNIEYLLFKLKKVDVELYIKYQKEYNELLSGLTGDSLINLRPTTLLGFQSLEASIEIDLFTNKHQANNILECLENLEKEYLNNVLTGKDKKTSITFKELEKINEMFLKIKDRYNLLEQRNVLKKLSLLYLFEIKENINDIDVKSLSNSYFVDNIKFVLLHIESLKELGLIKNNILIELNNDLNVASVLEIIKNIEFNVYEKEKANELVKRLEY